MNRRLWARLVERGRAMAARAWPRTVPSLGLLLAALLSVSTVAAATAPPAAAAPAGNGLSWGANTAGQLGDGTTTSRSTPGPVQLPMGTTITAIAAGCFYSLALTSTGQVLAWGANDSGQLGDGTTTSRSTPGPVQLPMGTTITAIAAGCDYSLAVTSTGQVLAWGSNFSGQLGNNSFTMSTTPVFTHLPMGTTVTGIAAGDGNSVAVTSTGQVLAWGDNTVGTAGIGTNSPQFVLTPVFTQLPAGTTVTAVSAGEVFDLALTSAGQVLAWGANSFGQLGDGTGSNRNLPVSTVLPSGTKVTSIATGNGAHHSLALTSAGQVLAWGLNNKGQLGDGTTGNSPIPVPVLLPMGTTVTAIAAGGADGGPPVGMIGHSLAVTSTGGVLGWGDNTFGEVGDGTSGNIRTTPVAVLPAGTAATVVSAGFQHSLAIATAAVVPMSTTTLSASPANPGFGQPVTLSAQVTCNVATPAGTVTFSEGPTAIGTATLSGSPTATASLTVNGLAAGSYTFTAHYNGSGSCPVSTSDAVTVTVNCQTISGSHSGPLSVTQPTCLAPGSQVTGPVTISGAGSLDAEGATIQGPLTATSGTGLRMCDSTVTGPTRISGINGVIIIGEPGSAITGTPGCGGNTLGGPVTLTDNTGFVELSVNQIGAPVTVNNNTTTLTVPPENASAAEIEANQISAKLACTGNTPPPINDGRPNTVTGPRSGQCTTL